MKKIIGLIIVFLIAIATLAKHNANAQNSISIVRDAEIEALIKEYATPLMTVAGLQKDSVSFNIVNNQQFNAFVIGKNLFLHTGLIMQAKTPNEVSGVLAHEFAHIAGAHQVRLAEEIKSAKRIAQVSTLLGVGIGAFGLTQQDEEAASAGIGIIGGGTRVAQRAVLAHQRDEELAADKAAINYLYKAMQSGKGMIDILGRLAEQGDLQKGNLDPYLLSHPVPRDRITNLKDHVEKSKYYNKKDSIELQKKHDMVRAKIAAYITGEKQARELVKRNELHPDARLYGKAIIAHLHESPKKALQIIEQVIEKNPNNPYAHEMKGEILLRSGKGQKAADAFKNAVRLDKNNSGFMRIEWGHALLESKNKKNIELAISQLRKGLARDPDTIVGYQHLARAYGEIGKIPNALLASAEVAVRTNQIRNAKELAERAQKGFKKGSPGWLRAEDILKIK